MVQYPNRAKTCPQSEKDGTILKQCQNLSPVRKRWYNTQTEPKPVTSQKKMIQYSNRDKTCQQSEKDGTILKQSQNLSTVKKDGAILKQCQNLLTDRKRWYNTKAEPKPVTSQNKIVQFSNRTNLSPVRKRLYNTQSQNLSPIRERWYNTQTVPKPDNR